MVLRDVQLQMISIQGDLSWTTWTRLTRVPHYTVANPQRTGERMMVKTKKKWCVSENKKPSRSPLLSAFKPICRKHQVHQSKLLPRTHTSPTSLSKMIVNQILTDTDREQQWRPVQLLKWSWKTMRSTCIIESFHHPFCFVIYLIKAKPFLVLYSIFMHAQRFYDIGGTQNQCRTEYLYFSNNKRQMFLRKLRQPFQRDLVLPL